jgi:hypothetical protein
MTDKELKYVLKPIYGKKRGQEAIKLDRGIGKLLVTMWELSRHFVVRGVNDSKMSSLAIIAIAVIVLLVIGLEWNTFLEGLTTGSWRVSSGARNR